jgi:hypothetical protein
MNPIQLFVRVIVVGWYVAFWLIHKSSIKMRLVRIPVRLKEERRSACSAETTTVSGAALIQDRCFAEVSPVTIFLADPGREGGCRRAPATLAVTVAHPVGRASQLNDAGSTKASAKSDFVISFGHATFASNLDISDARDRFASPVNPSGSTDRHTPPSRPAFPRCGSAGCTSPDGPTATATPS